MKLIRFKPLPRVHKVFIFLIGMLFLYGGSAVSADAQPQGQVVSLSGDRGGDLFIAYPQALYRFDTQTGKRESIPLPGSVERVAALVTGGAGTLYLAAPGTGVLRSVDGGRNWDVRNEGLSSSQVTGLIRHAAQPDTLYAVVPEEGIHRSEDGGGEWLLMHAGPGEMTDHLIHSDMPGSMQTGWIFAATRTGVSRSMDCFCLWREAGSLPGEVTALTYDPSQPSHIYAATGEGLFLSQDGGQSWSELPAPGAELTALHLTASGALYAGTRDGTLFRAAPQTENWERIDVF